MAAAWIPGSGQVLFLHWKRCGELSQASSRYACGEGTVGAKFDGLVRTKQHASASVVSLNITANVKYACKSSLRGGGSRRSNLDMGQILRRDCHGPHSSGLAMLPSLGIGVRITRSPWACRRTRRQWFDKLTTSGSGEPTFESRCWSPCSAMPRGPGNAVATRWA